LSEVWKSGAAYEPYVGRWSRLVAREFVTWLAVPPGARWLDVGCGTGALAATAVALAHPKSVDGVDQSAGYVEYASTQVPGAEFRVGDATALPYAGETFDAVVSALVLNFVPDPQAMVREMARVAAPGGVVALYVWDYAGEMQLMRRFWDAAVALNPAASKLDEGYRFPVCAPQPLTDEFGAAGLGDVEVRAIDVPTVFSDFGDYWSPFLGGQAPAPAYAMSLPDDAREALRDRLQSTLPTEPDGSIPLMARAWAMRGRRPA
jgi:SAM-dependent methyltransferase